MTHRSLNRYVFIGSTLLIAYFVEHDALRAKKQEHQALYIQKK